MASLGECSRPFSDFILLCDGHPMRGREAISAEEGFKEGCVITVRERSTHEAKPQGTT